MAVVHTRERRALLKRRQPQVLARWPIEGLVWPFVILVLLAGWIAVLAQVRAERADARQAAIARSQERATLLEQHVVKTLQVASLASLHLSGMYFGQPGRNGRTSRGMSSRIEDSSIRIGGMSGAAILGPDGAILATSGSVQRNIDPVLIAERHRPSDGASAIIVHAPLTAEGTELQPILITRQILRGDETVGYVALTFRPEQFLNFPLRSKFLPTDVVSVIGLDAITLARREGDRFSSGEDVSQGMVMVEQRRNPNGTYLGPSALDGHVRYFSHRRLADFPIFVTAGVSHSMALAQAERRAASYFLVMGIITILGLLMAWLVQREARFRKARSEELARSTKRLENAQRVGKIGDWEYDFRTGSILWSAELCAMYERPTDANKLTFEDLAVYFQPAELARLKSEFNVLLSSRGGHSYETQVVLPSGKISHRSINAMIARDAAGQIERIQGTDQDVTEAHLLHELEKHVAHLDRQGAMNMMTGTLAHELNQPLTAASNYLTGAIRAATTERASEEFMVSGIRSALDRVHDAAEIIRRARMMVEADTSTERSSIVREAIGEAVALLAASGFPQARAITVTIEPDLGPAAIPAIQLQQVLVNVLKNAMEAAAPGHPLVELRASGGTAGLLIEVEDNGPGFGSEPGDAFSVFRTSKKNGLGLGLPISRTIVEFHGGNIGVRTSDTGGTIIFIALPLASEPQSAAA